MNGFYRGNPNGTQTERASWAMTKQVVDKSDYPIDLHGGDLDESLRRLPGLTTSRRKRFMLQVVKRN